MIEGLVTAVTDNTLALLVDGQVYTVPVAPGVTSTAHVGRIVRIAPLNGYTVVYDAARDGSGG